MSIFEKWELFFAKKIHDFRFLMQMQRIPKKSRKKWLHKIFIINSQKDLGEKYVALYMG
jgi:hypothetical protein